MNRLLDENNYIGEIFAFTHQDWKPFIELIHKIEKISYFGEIIEAEKDNSGAFLEPYSIYAPIVSEFLKVVYDLPIIIIFDWRTWKEGWEILNNVNFDFDTLDIPMKCKLITAVVRDDRFCEGALVSAFNSGLILNILKSIEKEINSYNVN